MRKIAFVLLAALIAVGCGSSDDSEKETSSSMSSTTVIEETTTTEDEYVAPVDEEEDGYEEDDWDGAQQDSDRDTLVFLISGITGEDLGFVNVGFSGCVVDAVAEASGDDYSTALANVYSDDDAYSMEFEAAAISCISYLSAAELARLAEADDASDEDAPTVLDYDPQPVFWTIPEGEECGSQEYGRYIMIDGFCNNADICLDDPGHEACGDPAQYDWTSHACPVSDIHGETVRYGESLCQPIFCINENPSHVLCDDPSNYDVEEIAPVVIQDIVSGITDGDIEVSVRAQVGSTDTAKWAYRLPCSPEEVRTSDSRGNGDVYVRTYVAFEYSLEGDFVIIEMVDISNATTAGDVEFDRFTLSWEGGDCAAGYNDQWFNVRVDVDAA